MIKSALVRDDSGAVINTDIQALNKYKLERALYRKVDKLQSELNEAKACLKRLSDRVDKIEKR